MITAQREYSFSHCGLKFACFLILGVRSSILKATRMCSNLSSNVEAMLTDLGVLLSTDGCPMLVPIRSDSGYHRSPQCYHFR